MKTRTLLFNSLAALALAATLALSGCGKAAQDSTGNLYTISLLSTPSEAKSDVTLTVTETATGTPVTNATVTVTPMMHMASGDHHSAPVTAIHNHLDGDYHTSAYFLMPTDMGATHMGDWTLEVTVNGEAHSLPVTVAMAMQAQHKKLYAQTTPAADQIAGMMGNEDRTYHLFVEGFTGATNSHTFSVALFAKESMTSFPPVYAGAALHNAAGSAYNVATATVELSTDGGTSWTAMTSGGNGLYTLTPITVWASAATVAPLVRVTVDGEVKTTNGAAPTGANGYAAYSLTAP